LQFRASDDSITSYHSGTRARNTLDTQEPDHIWVPIGAGPDTATKLALSQKPHEFAGRAFAQIPEPEKMIDRPIAQPV
jgi:hypothetical protein